MKYKVIIEATSKNKARIWEIISNITSKFSDEEEDLKVHIEEVKEEFADEEPLIENKHHSLDHIDEYKNQIIEEANEVEASEMTAGEAHTLFYDKVADRPTDQSVSAYGYKCITVTGDMNDTVTSRELYESYIQFTINNRNGHNQYSTLSRADFYKEFFRLFIRKDLGEEVAIQTPITIYQILNSGSVYKYKGFKIHPEKDREYPIL